MDQLVLVILTHNTKQVILGIGCVPFNVFQVHTQHVVRSGGESCPVPTKILFSDHQSHICSLFSSGKNQPSRSVFSRTQSTLHRLSFGHRKASSKGRQVIRFNGVHSVSWIICGFVDFCVVSFD